MNILVTGSTGFIGGNLIEKLITTDNKVIGISNSSSHKIIHPNFKQVKANICLKEEIANVFNEFTIDVVVHLAALANKKGEITKEWENYFNVNVLGSKYIFEEAEKSGAKVIFTSSIDVYGITQGNFIDECTEVEYVTDYAKSKYKAEEELIGISENGKLKYSILRIAPVYSYDNKKDLYKRFYIYKEKIAFKIGKGREYHMLSINNLVDFINEIISRNIDVSGVVNVADHSAIHTNDIKRFEKECSKKFFYFTIPQFIPNAFIFIIRLLNKFITRKTLNIVLFNLIKLSEPKIYNTSKMDKVANVQHSFTSSMKK